MEYFCYISRDKVDMLYEQLDPRAHYEVTELRSKTTDVSLNASADWGIAHIVSLFKMGGSYGRKGVIQREDKVKKGYIEKLNAVLTSLAASSPIPPLAAVDDKERKRSLYYHYAGTFRIKEPVPDNPSSSTVATIAAKMDSRDILLDASLRNFSDGPMPDGSFNLHSGNYRFFKGDVSLYMTCVLVALEVSPKRVIGSPLFLQLTIADDDEKVVL